jgi:hypothetical protein
MHPTIERAFGLLPESERTKMRCDLTPNAEILARKEDISVPEMLEMLIEVYLFLLLERLAIDLEHPQELELSRVVWTSSEDHGRMNCSWSGMAVVDGTPVKCTVRFVTHPSCPDRVMV